MTPLREWQEGLIDLVTGQNPAPDPGVALTRAVITSWRTFRIESCAPLTLALLGPDLAGAAIASYVASTRSPSSFIVREGLAFLEHVEPSIAHFPHAPAVVALERALLVVRMNEAQPPSRSAVETVLDDPDARIERHPSMSLVRMGGNPAAIIGALLAGRPRPPERHDSGYVLCAPGLSLRMREATPGEVRLLEALDPVGFVGDLVDSAADEEALRGLLAACAAVRVPAGTSGAVAAA